MGRCCQGEYLHFSVGLHRHKPSYSGGGYYVFGTWMLTARAVTTKTVILANVKPAHEYGAFEVVARYQ